MGIIPAIAKIPARELTRRLVWLGAYLAFIHGAASREDVPEVRAKTVGHSAVAAYDAQFPQS